MKLDLPTVILTVLLAMVYVVLMASLESCHQVILYEKCIEVCKDRGKVSIVSDKTCVCKDTIAKK